MPRNQNIFHFESVTSTNDVCFEKCRLNEETNIIIANQQTQGRGRNSKKWVSPKGNISISIGFISDRPVEALSVKTGLVVARTINIQSIDSRTLKAGNINGAAKPKIKIPKYSIKFLFIILSTLFFLKV